MSKDNADPNHDGSVRKNTHSVSREKHHPIAEIVSMESVVNLLISKGFCTPEELWEQEKRSRIQFEETLKTPVVSTRLDTPAHENSFHVTSHSWLKRKMSKHKFTRRLGTRIFGWQWRKVKIPRTETKAEHLPVL
jgi:hypothetical protein